LLLKLKKAIIIATYRMALTEKDIIEFKRLYKEHYGEEISDFIAYEAANRLLNMIRAIYKPIPKVDEELYNKLKAENDAVPEDKKIDYIKHLVADAKLTEFKNEIGEKKYWELVREANTMILHGKQIYIKKGLVEENYPLLLKWFNDLDVMGYIGWVKRGFALKNIKELKKFISELEDGIIFGIYNRDDQFIGYTSLSDFKGKVECEFGIFILDKNFWGKGIGLEVTRLMLDYAFNRLGMDRVVLSTSEFHTNAIRLYEKAGFKKTDLISNDRTIFHNGEWVLSGTVEMESYRKEMKSEDIIDLYTELEGLGIKIWIDGGWAVDALIGKQTRTHEDLDIAIEYNNLANLKTYLESQGYSEIKRAEDKMWDLVMGDDNGHELDVHAFSFDDKGNVIEDKYWDGYSSDSLTGLGIIDGHAVNCVSPEQLLKTHDGTKRKLKDSDHSDMDALCKKFGINLDSSHESPPF
jgi:lincosamide nucleotidyltransferase A/C/D/E